MSIQIKHAGKSLTTEKDVYEVVLQVKPPDVIGEIRWNVRRSKYTFISYANVHFDESSLRSVAEFLENLNRQEVVQA